VLHGRARAVHRAGSPAGSRRRRQKRGHQEPKGVPVLSGGERSQVLLTASHAIRYNDLLNHLPDRTGVEALFGTIRSRLFHRQNRAATL